MTMPLAWPGGHLLRHGAETSQRNKKQHRKYCAAEVNLLLFFAQSLLRVLST